jgi:hypothetical protein
MTNNILLRPFNTALSATTETWDCTLAFFDSISIEEDSSDFGMLRRSEGETDDEWYERVETFIKEKIFPGEDIEVEIQNLEDEKYVDYWVIVGFRCKPDRKVFIAAIYDLVWEDNYFGRVMDFFTARAGSKGEQLIELTEEDFDGDGNLVMRYAEVRNNEEQLRQEFVRTWMAFSKRGWKRAWKRVWKQLRTGRIVITGDAIVFIKDLVSTRLQEESQWHAR